MRDAPPPGPAASTLRWTNPRASGWGRSSGRRAGATTRFAVCRARGSGGGGDGAEEPPNPNTWSSLAVPPPEEVGVPPTVIARYSFPSIE